MENNNVTPIFPKVSDCILFNKDHYVTTGETLKGVFAEVLRVDYYTHNGEIYNYYIYLGLETGYVIEFNYSLHKDKVQIVPNTLTSKVLYGK